MLSLERELEFLKLVDRLSTQLRRGLLWAADRPIRRLESTGPLVSAALPGLRWERRTLSIGDGD